ncbi:MAG: peptidoglycan hydrolase [Oscillospiraceae bacterium]|nr:MAG: peptidoglycan hydrolase [Oscillospiraceae bacterium]
MLQIYLSPSTQEKNFYVTGQTEETVMNRLADALEPYLRAAGIHFLRNTPEMTAAQVIQEANEADYDLHLALHSNASPEYGSRQGVEIYHFPGSVEGIRAAEIMAEHFKILYPDPGKVSLRPTTSLGEVDRVRAPSVYLEIGYHDNPQDAEWILSQLDSIARVIALSLTEYFGIPFVEPLAKPFSATVATAPDKNLNLRVRPDLEAAILTSIPSGETVTVYGLLPEWASVGYRDLSGFVRREYLNLM